LKEWAVEYLETDIQRRKKQGVLDSAGKIFKTLFGTPTGCKGVPILPKQMTAIKSTINLVNQIMKWMDQDEKVLRDSLIELNSRVNSVTFESQ
jgi:hypothetical protein